MDRRHSQGAAEGSPLGRGPREAHAAEATSKAPSAAPGLTDPELEQDLGAEYEFRGDVLEGELETARAEAAAHLETAQRVQAEFDNYRRRVARDAEDAAKRAGQRVITELLPALDNLERALAHVEAGGDGAELTDGVRMVLEQVLDVFGKEGVERIDPVGAAFDPNEHQAVGQAERADVPEGTVVEMFQCGYRMHGRVLRPAMVVVSTGGPRA
ncbi:MAG: nucleotide exchange factor GrpE [Aeromicrobium sp.]|nr:nucleotide exchange factor GrpE [Aeromicrobium sp.]